MKVTERPTRGSRILVVDDDPVLRALITRVLDWEGYSVVSTSSANAAVDVPQSDTDPASPNRTRCDGFGTQNDSVITPSTLAE